MPSLEDPIEINGVEMDNRLYRSPLLECAGNGDDAVDVLIRELEPTAEAGAGLIFQGATIVRGEGGCAAPGMTRVHDPEFVSELERLTRRVHEHGSRIFMQLEYGGLRSMEIWHSEYRKEHPDLKQEAPSPLPSALRLLDEAGFLDYDVHVLSTDEVYELAEDFARSAEYCVEAGYDGIHLSAANMGIIQQFLSPYYNRRDDVFGGSQTRRNNFLELLHDTIRERVGYDVPVVTKVPAETDAPPFVTDHISLEQGVQTAKRAEEIGFDAVVPVQVSTFWDASIIKGKFPERAWESSEFQEGYEEAFGSRTKARIVKLFNRIESWGYSFENAWNAEYARRVRDKVSVPVLTEGGIRTRDDIDSLLGDGGEADCDMVGMGRPFYAEPRLPARFLGNRDAETVCDNCNNCTVPQATGARGVCRTPEVLRKKAEYERNGAYSR